MWDGYLRRFAARGHDGHTPNLAGYHGSGPDGSADGTASFSRHVDDGLAVVAGLDRPVLVGHSVGGLVALKAATRADVAGCVMLAAIPPRGIVSLTSIRVMAPYLPLMLRGRPVLPPESAMRRLDLNRLPPAEQGGDLRADGARAGTPGVEIGLAGIPVRRADLRCPVLSVGGTDDALTPVRTSRAIAGGSAGRDGRTRGTRTT